MGVLERTILVLGASGGCGRLIVEEARARGHQTTAVVRPSTNYTPPESVRVLRGDVLDPAFILGAVAGHKLVINAVGIRRANPGNPWSRIVSPPDLSQRVAANLVAAMKVHGVERLVAISAAGVGDSAARLNAAMRLFISKSNLGVAYRDLERMERVLAASGLDWLAVRPTTLTNGRRTSAAKVVDFYRFTSRVSRAGVARFILDAAERDPPFTDRTPMVAG